MSIDPLSVVLGSLGLLPAALEVFNVIEKARSLGKDYALLFYRLQFEGLRLMLWAEESNIGLVSKQGLDVLPEPLRRPALLNVAKHCISIIALLLLEAGPLTKRYNVKPATPSASLGRGSSLFAEAYTDDLMVVNSENREQSIRAALQECLSQLQADVKRHQKSNSPFDKFLWAISKRAKFEELVNNIHLFTENLYSLLPRFQVSYLDRAFLNRTLAGHTKSELRAIESAAQGIFENVSSVASLKDLQLSSHQSLMQERPMSVSDLKIPSEHFDPLPKANLRWFPDSVVAHSPSPLKPGQRIFIEWKQYDRDLDASVKEKIQENAFDLTLCLQLNRRRTDSATLQCLGFFNDAYAVRNPRIGFVYRFPQSVNPALVPTSLLDLLSQRPPPDLGHRLAMASKLCEAFFYLLASNWLHKSLRSANILFFYGVSRSSASPHPDLACPYITGFEYSRPDNLHGFSIKPGESLDADRYRHPDYATVSVRSTTSYQKRHDIFSLGVVLLEIGLWEAVAALHAAEERSRARRKKDQSSKMSVEEFQRMYRQEYVPELPHRIGGRYARVVERCLTGDFGADEGDEGEEDGLGLVKGFDRLVVRELAQCVL